MIELVANPELWNHVGTLKAKWLHPVEEGTSAV
jgi:hypothetical protein